MEKILYCPYLYTQTQWSNYCATKPLPLEPVCPAIIMLFNNIALSNKPFILNNFVTAQNFDIFFVIQTLLKPDDCRPLHRTLPKFLNSPRCSGHGGGIAVVYKVYLICVPFDACSFDSFDLVSFNYSITDHIHHQRREGRKAKCRQKKTNLSPCSLQYPYEGVTSHTQPTHKRCENIFFKSLINNNKHSPKFLFDTISKLLNSP